jgi:methionine synthase II (cobalamin-independent)
MHIHMQLAKAYNEVVRENDKCKAVLAETQDKALARIEKLRNNRADLQRRLSDALQSVSRVRQLLVTRTHML